MPVAMRVAAWVLIAIAVNPSTVAADESFHVTTEHRIVQRRRIGIGLLTAGAALSIAGTALLAVMPTCSFSIEPSELDGCFQQLLPTGGALLGAGMPLLTAGAMLITDSEHEHAVMTRADVDAEIRRTRALAIGGIVGYVLSVGTAVGGIFLTSPNFGGGGNSDQYAGYALMVFGGSASGAMQTMSTYAFTRLALLRQLERGTAERGTVTISDEELRARLVSARRRTLAGGITAALSIALVAGGALLLADAPGHDSTPYNPAEGGAGIALVTVGAAGFVVGVPLFGDGLARRHRLAAARRPPSARATPTLLPWATWRGGGIRLAGKF